MIILSCIIMTVYFLLNLDIYSDEDSNHGISCSNVFMSVTNFTTQIRELQIYLHQRL